MAISVIQSLTPAQAAGVGSLQSSAFGSSVMTGSTIIVAIGTYITVSSVTDTQGNTYTQDFNQEGTGDPNRRGYVYRSTNVTGGSNFKITVSLTAGGFLTFGAIEVGGLTDTSPLDASSGNTAGSGTTASTGSFTTTEANELIVAFTATISTGGQSYSATPSGYTSFGQISAGSIPIDCQYKIVSSTVTENPQWTQNSDNWVAIAATYKQAGGASGNPWYYYANQALCSGGF